MKLHLQKCLTIIFSWILFTSALKLKLDIQDKVYVAYNDLLTSTYELLQDLQQQSEDNQNKLFTDLEATRTETAVQIMSKITEVTRKLEDMNRKLSAAGINVTGCTDKGLNYLLVYRDELLLRLNECMDTFGSEGLDNLKKDFLEIETAASDHLVCLDEGLKTCSKSKKNSDGGDDGCYEDVWWKIEREKTELGNFLNVLNVESVSRYENFDVPCKGMILNDMAFYPGAILKMTEKCTDFAVKKTLKPVCNF